MGDRSRKKLNERRWAVILAGVLIVTIPLVGLALFVHYQAATALENLSLQEKGVRTHLAVRLIEEKLRHEIDYGLAYAARPRLIGALEQPNKSELDWHLRDLVENNTDVQRAVVYTPSGIQLAGYPEDPLTLGKDFSHRDWYQGIAKSWTPYVSEFYLRAARPQRFIFSIALPVKGEGGRIIGILQLHPGEDYIQRTLSGITLEGGVAFVVDRHGHLVHHPGRVLDQVIDVSRLPAVTAVKKGLSGTADMRDPETGEKLLLSYEPVRPWGWGVVVQRPLRYVLAPVRRLTLGLVLCTGLMLLIGSFFAFKGADLLFTTRRLARQHEEGERVEKASAELLSLLNGQWPDAESLCQAFLPKLCAFASVEAGGLYLAEEGSLKPSAAFAAELPAVGGELAREALRQRQTLRLRQIPPESYLRVGTAFGRLLPRDVAVVPLVYQAEVLGVLELACLHGFGDEDVQLIERLAPQLAIGIDTLRKQAVLRRMTERLADSNQELQAMNEELQASGEELQAMNEELQSQQAELAQANARLAEVSRAKSDFLANMSHELRTPLNAVIGFSEVLEDQLAGPLNDKQREYVRDIELSGRHLLSLINDILDLAKVEAGKMVLEPGRFSLPEVLHSSLVLLKEKALKLGVRLDLELDPSAEIEIEADQRKVRQILFNLLSNAVKFTPEGGSVRVQARRVQGSGIGSQGSGQGQPPEPRSPAAVGDSVEITVEDTGIGIAAEDLPKLFKEFSQLESPYAKKYEGTGLGLALTRKLVELHGGRIRVESEPGKGSRFTFTLALRQPHLPAASPAPVTAAFVSSPAEPGTAGRGRRALLIDDDPQVLAIAEAALGEEGYQVLRAGSGEEGLALARQERPDLIVLDLMLPGMNGFEVVAALAAEERTLAIPALVLTGMSLSRHDRERLAGQVFGIEEKGSLTRESFLARVREAAAGRIGRGEA